MNNMLKYIAGLSVVASLSVSCAREDRNFLELTPVFGEISFAASADDDDYDSCLEDWRFNVSTDAGLWKVETSHEWIHFSKNEGRLRIYVDRNDTGTERKGNFTVTAGNADPVSVRVSQNAPKKQD